MLGIQAGSVVSRPLHLLTAQPGLWDAVVAAACMAGTTSAAAPEPRRAVPAHDDDDSQDQVLDAWRLKAQALATRVLALNCHLPGAPSAAGHPWLEYAQGCAVGLL